MGVFSLLKRAYRVGKAGVMAGVSTTKGVRAVGRGVWAVGKHLPGAAQGAARSSFGLSMPFGMGLVGTGAIALGISSAGRHLVSGGYNMDSAMVNHGDPSTSAPYQSQPMQFGAYRRSYLDQNATGSLAFSLHNMR